MIDVISRHERIALQFSGGKDSLACLYLLKPYWDRLTVMWCNTGAAFPETIEQMDAIRTMVPHFIEVKSSQPENIARCGPPSDVLSAWSTPFGRAIAGRQIPVQDPLACCTASIWVPMNQAVVDGGFTLIIRGQRNSETYKSPLRSGNVIEGIEYLLPLENWSEMDVLLYLVEQDVEVPDHYSYVNSSLDCMTCTAYLDENQGKFAYMRERHPKLYGEVQGLLATILEAMSPDLDALMNVYAGEHHG